ncbi:MAG: hypothetical protein WAM39_31690 [Bryobacteraceae bacterium]
MAAEGEKTRILERILPYITVLLILAVLYVGWTFYSRWRDSRNAEERAAAVKAEQNKKVVDQVFGSGEIKLLNFSISPIRLRRGETARLCYGVSNAVSVTISPHVEDTKPSYNHCLDIEPQSTTTYTLTAKDQAGRTQTGSLTVTVH